ncbi:MAG: fibronectin type III domain-containing protein [Armatimonadota bacterium]|nr:fibronectin type III domain-containing protein [Armatimonadota bacterium]
MARWKRVGFVGIYTLPITALLALGSGNFHLPGSQPNPEGYSFQSNDLCLYCHGDSQYASNPDTGVGPDPSFTSEHEMSFQWEGTMMAQSARDPVFRAALTIAEQDAPGAGQFCWRCHAPGAWLEGRSIPYDGSNFTHEDLRGIQCDHCHRMVDPRSEEGRALSDAPVPGIGNGMFVISPELAKRGPRADAIANHEWLYSSFHQSSSFCGVCHDVSNPLLARDPRTQPPHEYFPIDRIYSEWKLSEFAQKGIECQTCHMPRIQGKVCQLEHAPFRTDIAQHSFLGGNYWVPQILPMFWNYNERELDALVAGRNRTINFLRTAAKLVVARAPKSGREPIVFRVYNLTGHKFPSGDPESRRAWLHVEFLDRNGRVIAESGRYDFNTATLIEDPLAKVYRTKLAEGNTPTFHMMRANRVLSDNRIPPRGFRRSAFQQFNIAPVGANYRDGQFWDDTAYPLPPGTAKVRATLYFQVMTREYIEFLRDANTTDDWGQRLYQAWLATDKAPPIAIATAVYPTDKNRPTRPTNLRGQSPSAFRVVLEWTPSTDDDKVVYYEIWRRAPHEREFRKVGTTFAAETTYIDAGLHPDTPYQYYVRAVDTSGNVSTLSNIITVRTQP